MKVIFRDANKSDFEPLCRVYEKPYGSYEIARKFVRMYLDHYFVKVVESEGKIIGRLIWFPREDPKLGWAEILDLRIKHNYQRRGLKSKLMSESIDDIKAHFKAMGHKVRCIILFISEDNQPARRLYRKMGFKKVGYGGYVSEKGARELLYSLNFL
jgi:ribosomal protein S18 acetylase RimI-like enzyme